MLNRYGLVDIEKILREQDAPPPEGAPPAPEGGAPPAPGGDAPPSGDQGEKEDPGTEDTVNWYT